MALTLSGRLERGRRPKCNAKVGITACFGVLYSTKTLLGYWRRHKWSIEDYVIDPFTD